MKHYLDTSHEINFTASPMMSSVSLLSSKKSNVNALPQLRKQSHQNFDKSNFGSLQISLNQQPPPKQINYTKIIREKLIQSVKVKAQTLNCLHKHQEAYMAHSKKQKLTVPQQFQQIEDIEKHFQSKIECFKL